MKMTGKAGWDGGKRRMGGEFDQNIVYACMKFSNKKKSKNCVSSIVNYLNQKYVRNKGHIIKKKRV